MDLGSFLADESLGGNSWADEEVDMSSIGVQIAGSTGSSGYSSYRRDAESSWGDRPEREEYPVPDHPPFRARVGNLTYDVTENELAGYFEQKLKADDIVDDVKVPVDNMTGKPKGFGFISFTLKAALEEALRLTSAEMNGRRIYVNVAAPQKPDVFDMDWRGARGQGQLPPRGDRYGGDRFGGDRPPRRDDVDIDWTSARGTGQLPPRGDRYGGDRPDREDRPPRREEVDIDWTSARGSGQLPPREPRERTFRPDRPKRDEPDLDWGSARGTGVLPPRERSNRTERPERTDRPERVERPKKDEPELDWGSARGTGVLPPRERSNRTERPDRPKKDVTPAEWKRGQALEPRSKSNRATQPEKKDDQPRPQKSSFDVLAVEGGDSDEEEEATEAPKPKEAAAETGLEKATEGLSVEDGNDGWEVVGK